MIKAKSNKKYIKKAKYIKKTDKVSVLFNIEVERFCLFVIICIHSL